MNANGRLHFLLKCHMPSSACRFNFVRVNRCVVFSFTSRTTRQILICVCHMTCILLCKFLSVKLQKLCQKDTLNARCASSRRLNLSSNSTCKLACASSSFSFVGDSYTPHTCWCGLAVNDSYQQGALLELF
jgi:hypothetical protein